MTYANIPRAPHLCLSNLGDDWQKTRIIRTHVHYHDRASLLAGKLHAVHTPKGATSSTCSSDPGWPSLNLTLLNHMLAQTSWRARR